MTTTQPKREWEGLKYRLFAPPRRKNSQSTSCREQRTQKGEDIVYRRVYKFGKGSDMGIIEKKKRARDDGKSNKENAIRKRAVF